MSRLHYYLPQHLQTTALRNNWNDSETASVIHQHRLQFYDDPYSAPDLEDTREELGLVRRGVLGQSFDAIGSSLQDLAFDAGGRVVGGLGAFLGDVVGDQELIEMSRDIIRRNQRDPNPSDGLPGLIGQATGEIAKFGLAFLPFIGQAGRASMVAHSGASFVSASAAKKAAYLVGGSMIASEYGRFRHIEEDIEPIQAGIGAVLMGAAEFAGDRLTLGVLASGRLLKDTKFQNFLSGKLGKIGNFIGGATPSILATSATSAMSEAATEFLQGGINEGVVNPDATLGSVLDAAANPEGILHAAALGALVGGGLGSINMGISAYLQSNYPEVQASPTNSNRDPRDPNESVYDQIKHARNSITLGTELGILSQTIKDKDVRSVLRSETLKKSKADLVAKMKSFDPKYDPEIELPPDPTRLQERTREEFKYEPEKPDIGYFSEDALTDSLSNVVGNTVEIETPIYDIKATEPREAIRELERAQYQVGTRVVRKERQDPKPGQWKNIDVPEQYTMRSQSSSRLHAGERDTRSDMNFEFFRKVAASKNVDEKISDLEGYLDSNIKHTENLFNESKKQKEKEDLYAQHEGYVNVRNNLLKLKRSKKFNQQDKTQLLRDFVNNPKLFPQHLAKNYTLNYGIRPSTNPRHEPLKQLINQTLRPIFDKERLNTSVTADSANVNPDTNVIEQRPLNISEFLDIAIRRPDVAERIAPATYKEFEKFLNENKDIGSALKHHQELSFKFEKQPEWFKSQYARGKPANIWQRKGPEYMRRVKRYLSEDDTGDSNPIIDDRDIGNSFGHYISNRNLWADMEYKYGITGAEVSRGQMAGAEGIASHMAKEGTTDLTADGFDPQKSVTYKGQVDGLERIESEMFEEAKIHADKYDFDPHEVFHDTRRAQVVDSIKHGINTDWSKNMMEKHKINLDDIKKLTVSKYALPKERRDFYAHRIHNQMDRLVKQLIKYGKFSRQDYNNIVQPIDDIQTGFKFVGPLKNREQSELDPTLWGYMGLPNLRKDIANTNNEYDLTDTYRSIREQMSSLVYTSVHQKLTEDNIKVLAELGSDYVTIKQGSVTNKPKNVPDKSYVLSYWGQLGEVGVTGETYLDPTRPLSKQRKKHYWIVVHNKDFVNALKTLPRQKYGKAFKALSLGRTVMTGLITAMPKFIGTAATRSIFESYATAKVDNFDILRGSDMISEVWNEKFTPIRESWELIPRDRDENGKLLFTKEKPPTYRDIGYTGVLYSSLSGVNVRNEVNPGSFGASLAWDPKNPGKSFGLALANLISKGTTPAQMAEMLPRFSATIQALEQGHSIAEAGDIGATTTPDYRDQPTVKELKYLFNLFLFQGAQVNSLNRWGNVLFADENRQFNKKAITDVFDFDINKSELTPEARHHLELKRRAWFTLGVTMTTLAAVAYAWNNSDDERQEKYNNLSAFDKARYFNLFIGDTHLKFPLIHESALVVAAATTAMETLFENEDRDTINLFAQAFAMSFEPAIFEGPSVVAPVVKHLTNRRFGGGQLVPDWMSDRLPEDQAYIHTNDMYKLAGELTGTSPLIIENYFSGYAGYLMEIFEAVYDELSWDEDRYGDKPFNDGLLQLTGLSGFNRNERNSVNRWTREFSVLLDESQAAQTKLGTIMEEYITLNKKPKQEDYNTLRRMAEISRFLQSSLSLAGKVNRDVMNISHNKNLSKSEKERMIIDLYVRLNNRKEKDFKRATEHLDKIQDRIYFIENAK